MFITYKDLLDRRACIVQREKFRELFPNGVEITPELCRAHAQDFDWCWAAMRLLSPRAEQFFHREEAAIWGFFINKIRAARAGSDTEFEEIRADARRVRNEAQAVLFAKCAEGVV